MTRIVGSDRSQAEITINDGKVHKRQKDGTFHVGTEEAKLLVKSGDFAVAGTNFRNARGYRCQDCNFLALLTTCKCGSTNTVPED